MASAVIYARTASPRRPIGPLCKQERLCREHAAALGLEVKSTHTEVGVPGLELDAAVDALVDCDVLVVYDLARLGRDLAWGELIHRRVADAGARIETVLPSLPISELTRIDALAARVVVAARAGGAAVIRSGDVRGRADGRATLIRGTPADLTKLH